MDNLLEYFLFTCELKVKVCVCVCDCVFLCVCSLYPVMVNTMVMCGLFHSYHFWGGNGGRRNSELGNYHCSPKLKSR